MKVKNGIFNVRGMKKRLQAVEKLSKGMWALGLCETWIKKGDNPNNSALDESMEAPDGTPGGEGTEE